MYEVEKRALLEENEFESLKKRLTNKAELIEKKNLKTFLFVKPQFLRIRLVEGQKSATITYKSGDYQSTGRKEVNLKLSPDQLKNFVRIMESLGFKKCSFLKTDRQSYRLADSRIELNKIDYLGNIVEIEKMVKTKDKVKQAEKEVIKLLDNLGLQPLSAQKYQKMMDQMYKKSLKPLQNYYSQLGIDG